MKVIFCQILSDEKHNLMMDYYKKDSNFKIDFGNFHEFFDCNEQLEILKEKGIKYELLLDDSWLGKKTIDYTIRGKILVDDIDYEQIKDIYPILEDYYEVSPEEQANNLSNDNADNTDNPIQNKNTSNPLFSFILGLTFIIILIFLIINN